MDRRDALKALAASLAAAASAPLTAKADDDVILTGWKQDNQSLRRWIAAHKYPFFSQQNEHIKGSGENKIVMLHPLLERVQGRKLVPHHQTIGDCVSHGFGLCVDVLTASQILMHKRPERWVAEAATEIIYAGSRVEVGGGIRGDGSTGHWAADFITRWGIMLRQEYSGFDFTTYSGEKARELGQTGVPDVLEPIAKLHPVKTVSICKTYEEARDSIANGYPIGVCSNVGFGSSSSQWVRDRDGFLTRKRAPWYHCMAFIGVDDKSDRKGILCQNSWGDWVSGPTKHNQPAGSFWIDRSTVNSMLQVGDSFSLSSYVGYPRSVPPYVIYG